MRNNVVLGFLVLMYLMPASPSRAATCVPTEPDMLGPFYISDAPVRSSVGTGYLLTGVVRSSRDCAAVPGAMIELWLAGPDGSYDDAHRATIFADAQGGYRFESTMPRPVDGRPPHIHLRVSAAGFRTLVTQQYPDKGAKEAVFDVVLVPGK